ncbi:MFS transporter [Demequina sp. TTPB684]|uniref:MFS transporter n=1 Tax=unclassified Demequina TaxID=2620311 RepID=UPI001CF4A42F|nr:MULTISPECIES: MFS transporter [unclassified Demequina]MCB2412742.1 MFS transporter [Demequina sp. TTPB684]UPU88880.1 MFS transporter [Demequina sp. TMPB413]
MTATERVIEPARLRKARIGVSLLFLANGGMLANLVPRLPEIKDQLELSYTGFGVAWAFGSLGGITLGLLSGAMLRRFGSARLATLTLAVQAFVIWGAGVSPAVLLFAALLFVNGALDANTDVAQNAQGMGVQRQLGRSIINGLHAMWSLGAALGGLLGGAAIALGLSVGAHLGLSAVLFLGMAAVARVLMLGPATGVDREEIEEADDAPRRRFRIPRAAAITLVMLGLVAIAGAVAEDAAITWSSIYMAEDLGVDERLAGYALVSLMALHFVGRLAGDKLVDRWGNQAVARAGGALTAVGMGVALAWPTVAGTLVGFAAAGLGVATTIPAAFAASDEIPGIKPGTGITMVSWALRLSFLVGPPLVGVVADATSLRVGLLLVPVAGVAVVLLAGSLTGRGHRDVSPPAVITPAH